MKAAERISDISEYYFATKLREIRGRQEAGEPIINLGIGSPDLAPPRDAQDALISRVLTDGSFMYKPYLGISGLREAVSDHYSERYNIELSPDQVVPLMGSKEGVAFASLAYLDPGDEVLTPNPGYPAYEAVTKMAGGVSIRYDLEANLNWHPDPDRLAGLITPRTKMLWLNYPNMPTGANANPEILQQVIELCHKNNILICHDNPYSSILTTNPFSIFSIEGAWENTIEFNSLSKSFNMAGARVGFVCGKNELIAPIFKVQSNFSSGMFEPVQRAAIAALKLPQTEWFQKINNVYEARRDIARDMLSKLNCNYDANASGMFVWGAVPPEFDTGEQLSEKLLNEAHVFIAPGHIFGSNGNRYIRVSLCASIELLEEARKRITNPKLL